ncbi:MAG: excinuclease ABC subunit UvrA [Pirellulales bacterium]|nr:excinuclease ABC subunit UvrA [Pirellulales bacterium]
MNSTGRIVLRGVAVHNLKSVDLDLPHCKLIVFCGLSGSGKSSLALDTLYAEGQRRYIESFSAYTRQFLQRLEKPEAERIDGIPPAIAVTGKHTNRSSRSTVGTATETNDYLRLLFAKIGRVFCRQCGREVRCDSPQSTAEALEALPDGARFLIAFRVDVPPEEDAAPVLAGLKEEGFIRLIADGRLVNLAETPGIAIPERWEHDAGQSPENNHGWYAVVDRLTAGGASESRLRDSLETAFHKGRGRCFVFVEEKAIDETAGAGDGPACIGPPCRRPLNNSAFRIPHSTFSIDGVPWQRRGFSTALACEDCGVEYPAPEPQLFSFNSPLGACPECEGFGNVIGTDMELIVPDANKSLGEGAIAPWSTPAYEHELRELLALAEDFDIPTDVPFKNLDARQLGLIRHGVPERNFGGLDGFFRWLERRKYKMHVRVFLSRWRSYRTCPACRGARLRPEALAVRVGGKNLGEIAAMKVREAAEFFRTLNKPAISEKRQDAASTLLTEHERRIGRMMLDQVQARLGYLEEVGLGYLTLDRPLRTLSGGEARRVALTAALGSSLVNMLYVLDEPSIGLHPRDIHQLLTAVEQLRDRGNTVVVVEHEETMIRAADQVVEIGPGAGERGGRIVFQGPPREMTHCAESLTGDYLAGRRGMTANGRRRAPNHGWIRLAGARGNNLQGVTVEFPLGMLCLVTGVSGSGKSTLVEDTLYPALCRRLRKEAPKPLPHDDVFGDGQIDDVIMVDQSPIGRSPRSNPVTYLKVFDEIRRVFADTVEAKTRGFDAGHFSFNVGGGRCSACEGDGYIQIDMQFLADVYMRCSQCNGARYRDEILEVTYRGRNIADVLEMTVREAFTFFRGQPKVQARLKKLIDVGLDYVRLGQPANTLSGGEAQRLKLAGYTSGAKRGRCLFILDEPTTGLHFSDVVQLLDCFDALLSVGHSLIVVEHNLQMMKAADYLIDLGPGAADEGGRIVAKGTPEMVARSADSVTGKFLTGILTEES